jgi:LEA14-like dessication related protein
MISMNKKLLWALLPFLLAACARPKDFDYLGVSDLKVLKFGLKESTVGVNVKYYNPNKYPVTMKHANVDVYVNNNYFGKTILDSTIHISGRDTFFLPVLLTVEMNNNAMSLMQSFSQGQHEFQFRIEGKARVGRGGFYINYPIKYEGTQKFGF